MLGAAALLLIAIAAVSSLGYKTGKVAFPFFELYLFQRAKVDAAGEMHTVFVGDSSLGNAIDARMWAVRTGEPALNLALTGAFGYGGSLNMIRRALAHGGLRRVVVMQTPDMLTRGISYRGYLLTSDRLFPLGAVPLSVMVDTYLSLDTALSVVTKMYSRSAPPAVDPIRDYIEQSRPLSARPAFVRRYRALRLDTAAIVPGGLHYLHQIAALCRAEKLDCVYAHGPILDVYCASSSDYFKAANALIESTGLRVVAGTPVCMPLAEAGDSEDHVRPDLRAGYTKEYLDLINDFAAARSR
ncbi:MAG: hypothetical protein ABIS45_06035 [Burkholderiales bacterium]